MATDILNKVTARALRPWRESRLRRYLDPDRSELFDSAATMEGGRFPRGPQAPGA